MVLLREMTFVALCHHPAKRQRPVLIHHVEHQRGTASAHFAAVHHQQERQMRQAGDEGLGIRQEVSLDVDPVVVDPPGKAFDTTFGTGVIEHLFSDLRKIGPLAAHDAANQGRQGCQMPSQIAFGLFRIQLPKGFAYRTIPVVPEPVEGRRQSLIGYSFLKLLIEIEYTTSHPF